MKKNVLNKPIGRFAGIAAVMAFALPDVSIAGPIFSNTAVVSSPTNVATFDGLTVSNVDLNGYTEDGLVIDVDDSTYVGFQPFAPDPRTTQFHYAFGGNSSWVTISRLDGGSIHALDFLLGNGFFADSAVNTNLVWETIAGASSSGSGAVTVARGSTVGWTDISGFDSMRVAAVSTANGQFGDPQGIALDDVRIGGSSTAPSPAPNPATIALFGLGLLGMRVLRKA